MRKNLNRARRNIVSVREEMKEDGVNFISSPIREGSTIVGLMVASKVGNEYNVGYSITKVPEQKQNFDREFTFHVAASRSIKIDRRRSINYGFPKNYAEQISNFLDRAKRYFKDSAPSKNVRLMEYEIDRVFETGI